MSILLPYVDLTPLHLPCFLMPNLLPYLTSLCPSYVLMLPMY
jgi:hypothetical protein